MSLPIKQYFLIVAGIETFPEPSKFTDPEASPLNPIDLAVLNLFAEFAAPPAEDEPA